MIYKTIDEWIEHNPNHIGALPIEVCHQIWGTKGNGISMTQPEQEPVAGEWIVLSESVGKLKELGWNDDAIHKANTPQRTWVGLTNKEFAEILCDYRWQGRPDLMMLQVQAKLKQKNTRGQE